jgi:hypothetical protein
MNDWFLYFGMPILMIVVYVPLLYVCAKNIIEAYRKD